MKNKVVIVLVILTAIMFNACKKNTTEPANGSLSGNFYPNGDGTSYKYNVQKTDSSGTTHTGSRSAQYNGTTSIGGMVYQNEVDTISIDGITTVYTNLFNKSNSGVSFALDTTGLSSSIPGEYLPYISFDTGFNILQFPFQDGASWPVFNMYLTLQGVKVNVVSVTANYMGTEPITLSLNTGTSTETAAKVQYQFKLITNPLSPGSASVFTANAWLVDNIGVVKWQGNGTILDVFTGGGINFADTTSTITQTLTSYNVK